MNKEQLRFNPTILTLDGKRYIEIIHNGQTKCLILDKVIRQARYVIGWATTCQKGHCKGDTFKKPLVIKDLQQYPEREEEGKLLREILEKGVVNIARYYHYETVCVDGQNNNIYNICKGLDIIKVANYKLKGLIMLLRLAKVQISIKKGRSSSRKRSFNALLLPSKRIYLSSLIKRPIIQNRVY